MAKRVAKKTQSKATSKTSEETLAAEGVRKLNLIEQRLNDYFMEREEVIHTSVLALASRQHHFQLGPPGTAKSAIARAIGSAVEDAAYFEKLMTRTMEPDELFGPLSMKGVTEDEDYRRNVDGFAPTSHIWFLDEKFKASDAVLNNLLDAYNERKFRNGREVLDVPLISCFSGSNELYEGSALEALYSRVAFRHKVDYVQERDNHDTMLDNIMGGAGPDMSGINLKLDEINAVYSYMRKAVDNKHKDAKDVLWDIRTELTNNGLCMDDRKEGWILRDIVPAEALLSGQTKVAPDHFAIMRHCLWDTPDQIQKVRSIVLKVAAPTQNEASEAVDGAVKEFRIAERICTDANSTGEEQQKAAMDANSSIVQIINKLKKRIEEVESAPAKRRLQDALNKVQEYHRRLLEDILHLDV